MQRSRVISAGFLFLLVSVASAQRDKAILELLKPIVAEIAASPNVGGWTWEINGNGGYLLKKSIDVTGDGRPELFVASTLESSKDAHVWHVFDVAEDGKIRPYSTTLNFISATPRTENGLRSLDLFPFADEKRLRISHEKPYSVVHYSFSYPTVSHTTSYVSEADAITLQAYDVSQLPKLQAILLADFLTNPDAEWADVIDWKLDVNDCFFQSIDKERAANNTSFTPQEAVRLLGVNLGGNPRDKRRSDSPARVNLDQVRTERMLPADRLSLTGTGFSTQWPWVVLMGFVIVAIFSWLKWIR